MPPEHLDGAPVPESLGIKGFTPLDLLKAAEICGKVLSAPSFKLGEPEITIAAGPFNAPRAQAIVRLRGRPLLRIIVEQG